MQVLQDRIDSEYYVNMDIGGMPATMDDVLLSEQPLLPGFPLGVRQGDVYLVHNHLSFIALTRQAVGAHTPEAAVELIGFMVIPCSIRRGADTPPVDMPCRSWEPGSAPTPQVVAEGEAIEFTYDVFWPEVEVRWSSRWQGYLGPRLSAAHWKCMHLAMVTLGLLWLLVGRVFRSTLGRGFKPLAADTPSDAPETKEQRWRRVAGTVFQPPRAAAGLAVRFGSGVQVLAAAAATLLLANAVTLPPDRPDALRRAGACFFFCFAPLAGFAAVALLRAAQRSAGGWVLVCVKTAACFPGLVCAATALVDHSMAAAGAAASTPSASPAALASTALAVGLPLTLLGGALALITPVATWPGAYSKEPDSTLEPSRRSAAAWVRGILYFAVAAVGPFSMFYAEQGFVMDALWRHVVYTPHAFLALAAGLTVAHTVGASILCTHRQLITGDAHWWWPAFHRGGAAALCVIVTAVWYRGRHFPDLAGPGLLLYTSYIALAAAALYLCLGAVGLASSLAFLTLIFSRHAAAEADAAAAAPTELEQPADVEAQAVPADDAVAESPAS